MSSNPHVFGKFPSTRLRRTRSKDWSRRLVCENYLSANDLILPIFLTDGENVIEEIPSMPGIKRLSVDNAINLALEAHELGIPAIVIFPNIPINKRSDNGEEAFNENNIVNRGVRAIKSAVPNLGIITDIALDPYTSHGHDGLLKNGTILNDETIKALVKQSITQAKAGCDIVAPSDMMDGRIGAIREGLDNAGFEHVQIMAYSVKYASGFYGPFRDAVGSLDTLEGDKKTYQMDYANSDEAIREVALDIEEGADSVIVKPGMPYLDIIKSIKEKFKIPVFAYQVSGEYSLLSNAINKKIISDEAIFESLISFKRAGANAIVSYYADRLDKILV